MKNIQPFIAMKDTDLFDSLLIDFQPDLKKIIGKFRRQGHLLDPDEILSEVNAYLLKKKEDIINYRDEENGVVEFLDRSDPKKGQVEIKIEEVKDFLSEKISSQ